MKYVPEINGARAVAVVSVLLYHLNFHWIPGGFVGVDIFFVISGYLITSIIGNDLARGRFSFREFYGRRMLRILPALYVVSVVTALVFSLLFPPQISTELLKSMVAGLLSYSNIWFYFTVDYFGDNVTQPTLHYWSLAVEEQFYFVLPLLYWWIWGRGGAKWRWPVFGALFAISLVWSGLVVEKHQSQAFFLPWLRAWELLAGSLLSLVQLDRIGERLKGWLADIGLAMLLLAIFTYDEKMVFPGYSALLPVAGTVLLIAGAGSGRSIANWLLRQAPAQWLGKVSYSLYLVHWPLICLVSLVFALSIKYKLLLLVVSLVAAWISWRFVESPFRRSVSEIGVGKVFKVTGAVTAACAALFVLFNVGGTGLWRQYPQAIAYAEAGHTDLTFFHRDTCFLTAQSDALRFYRRDLCLSPVAGRDNVLVIGDSHGANIVDALRAEYPAAHIMQATAVGCKPTLDSRGAKRCTDLVSWILKDWLPGAGAGVTRVVLAGRWDGSDAEAVSATVTYLDGLGRRPLVYGPVPEYMVPVPLILAYEQIVGRSLRERLVKSDRAPLDQAFAARFGELYFSPYRNLCPAAGCIVERDGAPVFFDRDHLTVAGARIAVRGMPLALPADGSAVSSN